MKCGLLVKGKEQELPLRNVTVHAQLKGYTVGLDSTLRYRNETCQPLEVLFRFPVDESMAVVGLEAVLDGRRIRAQMKEKEEAKATYGDAIASGMTAALGEENAGDVFSLSLGNLAPGTEAELRLKLVGELAVDSETGAVQFSLPTVLKPRYTPAGAQDPLAPVGGGPTGQVGRGKASAVTAFKLQVWGAENVSSISSPTHEIATEDKDGMLEVSLKQTGPLDKDLVILVHQKDPHQPKAMVEEGLDGGNELMSSPAVMLDFFPNFESKKTACEFVFLVDRSGSMDGSYIDSARETLILFLKSIPPGCYFNIVGFGSSYQQLFPESVPYNQSNLDQAMGHARSMSANLGGTELLRPLNFIIKQKLIPGLPRQVFILTDGSVSNTGACVDAVKKNVHLARVFTFGIGSGASTALVKGLARAGNGSAEFIKEGERMQPKVISSLKKALQPSVSDVVLEFDVPEGVEVQQAPSKIPPVFNGDRLVMYGVLKSKKKECITGRYRATLSGKLLGGTIKHTVEFVVSSRGEVPASFHVPIVHHLTAKRLINDLQNEEGSEDASSRNMKAIIQLSVDSSVISTYTAYVAVDEVQGKPIEGAMKMWDLTATERGYFGSLLLPCSSIYPVPGIVCQQVCPRGAVNRGQNRKKRRTSSKIAKESFVVESYSAAMRVMSADFPSKPSVSSSSQLIALQTAEGFWQLDKQLADIVGKPWKELAGKCPASSIENVWATVLALTLLKERFSHQKEEWELVAMKAETWLQDQTLPVPHSLDSLSQAAMECLA